MSSTQSHTVTGMTCGHCVASVTEEVQENQRIDHVDVVAVEDAGYQLA
jgi:copper chaperone